MLPLRRLLWIAAKRVAADERVQAKASQVIEAEIKPRARAAWGRTKPKLERARSELRDMAAETDPRRDPGAFVANVAKRLRRRRRS